VLLEFCGSDGTCFTTVDRHLYYDRDLNAEFQWSDETGNWTAAAADVHRGSARLLICVIAYFGCSIYVSGVTGLAFCHQVILLACLRVLHLSVFLTHYVRLSVWLPVHFL
jgi:hypothetical protein